MSEPLLCLRDFACARGGVPILEGVSFDLHAGRALILRGPNGIGKTTLLRCLAGLQPVTAGQVRGDEENITYAGHTDGVKLMLTVTENLAFWADIYGQDCVDAALNQMNLTGLADRAAQNLSAGQRRRLGLARLLVTGRRLWVLDEPTVSLDAASVEIFATMLRAHLTSGGAAVIATHIDVGVEGDILDLTPFKAKDTPMDDFSEAFL